MGTQWNFNSSVTHPQAYWWYVGNAPNDQISSIVNTHTAYKAWFDNACPAGAQYTWVGPLQKAPNLANNKWPNGSTMNDSISAEAIEGGSAVPKHGSRPAGGC